MWNSNLCSLARSQQSHSSARNSTPAPTSSPGTCLSTDLKIYYYFTRLQLPNMSGSNTSFFLYLPGEIKLGIYGHILDDIAANLQPRSLKPYGGFIVSFQQIKNEFEHEWALRFAKLLRDHVLGSVLHPVRTKNFGQAHRITYQVPNGMEALETTAMSRTLATLPSISDAVVVRSD